MNADAALLKRSGLSIVRDIVLAPRSAFEALAERTHWGWAFLFVCILGCAGSLLQSPAGEHIAVAAITQNPTHNPQLAEMSPAQTQQAIKYATLAQKWSWAFYPLIAIVAIGITSLVLLAGNAITRGAGSFARLFGLAANVAVVNWGIYLLLVGALAALRGPDSFFTQRDLINTVPSLAWLAPGASPKLAVLLSEFNPFQIWSFFLVALGLGVVAKLPRIPAYVLAAIVTFGSAALSAPFAK